jgi:hypothetical protein
MERILKSISYLVIGFCILGISFVAFPLWKVTRGDSAYLVRDLYPVVLGLCLEGILFVGVLGALQDRAAQKRKQLLRNALTMELRFLRSVMMNVLRTDGLEQTEPIKDLLALMKDLKAKSYEDRKDRRFDLRPDWFTTIAVGASKCVQVKATIHLRRLGNVTSLAAELDAQYLTDWMFITDRLVDLAQIEPLSDETIKSFGERIRPESTYSEILALLEKLEAMGIVSN